MSAAAASYALLPGPGHLVIMVSVVSSVLDFQEVTDRSVVNQSVINIDPKVALQLHLHNQAGSHVAPLHDTSTASSQACHSHVRACTRAQ